MSHDENEHGEHCHHHHSPQIEVAQPVSNSGEPEGPHGQPLPGTYQNPNPNAVITELEDGTVKIVITQSIRTFTYFIKPFDIGLRITTLAPHGMNPKRGNNGEIFIEPNHVN